MAKLIFFKYQYFFNFPYLKLKNIFIITLTSIKYFFLKGKNVE